MPRPDNMGRCGSSLGPSLEADTKSFRFQAVGGSRRGLGELLLVMEPILLPGTMEAPELHEGGPCHLGSTAWIGDRYIKRQ